MKNNPPTPRTLEVSGSAHPGGTSIRVGSFIIDRGMTANRVWLERATGDRANEGGDFSIEEFDAMIEKFYEERF